ncbi:DJ-1/PfpI family protein [Mucilaginibacter lappiensis]|uniref:Transcriptional regulator GlxA family with amidase domain n=1 Tax=Mucilaginibacter lappiensis TaxID=354630 RepID=A0A841JBP8_9SPHI|nr:DJ-1/PfpI family protein [Mucilaginibacter lappiensis]MBB6128327.1 transcriptional regulator GlxA family with amidase domain [Mucilaginibacter lappiensis]
MKTRYFFLLLLLPLMGNIPSVQAQVKMAWYCPPCSSDCDQTAYAAPGKCPLCGMTLVQEAVAGHQQKLNLKRMKVLFYLQDGVEVLDFAGPLEVFSYAGFDVSIVSKTKDPISSQGVLKITPDYSIADAPPADILAFFGGNAGNAANDPAVIAWLKAAPAPAYYFSVCTGAFILGKAGFLDHLTVTTFHESIESLRQAVPQAKVLENVRFVDNGKVMTTAGISAGIDGALHLVEKIRGREAAARIAKYMEYDKWVPGQGLVITPPNGTP